MVTVLLKVSVKKQKKGRVKITIWITRRRMTDISETWLLRQSAYPDSVLLLV
jgi:hypothetical protein